MNDKKTILVVDDMRQIREILRFSLRRGGYNVVLAEDGMEAIKYANSNKPLDLIVLDIMMPKMDGYEVIKEVRTSKDMKQVPIIFLTAKAQKKDILKGIEVGANDYVVKPYKFVDLQRKIEKLISQQQEEL